MHHDEVKWPGPTAGMGHPAQLIFDNIPALVAYWDKDEVCRFANRAYLEWFGIAPETLYGRTLHDLLGAELYTKNRPYIVGALRGEPQHFERDLIRRGYGDLRHTQASYIPNVIDGTVDGFFVLVTDVTDRKRAELEAIKAKDEALASWRVKNRFLANVSHEIRTPMNGVIGMLELARSARGKEREEYLEAATHSADHLLHIINDILDVAKMEAGELTLTAEPFDLRQSIHECLSAQFVEARKKGLKCVLEISPDVPARVIGDSVRLRQVILNLVRNAVKFTQSGQIGVDLRLDSTSNDILHFVVTDTGVGIKKDDQERIFERFSQVDESRTRAEGGTGLGLSICRDLVQRLGGRIWLESEQGRGSRFHFTVNMIAAPTDAPAPLQRDSGTTRRRLRVLLAEDDPVSRQVQKVMLTRLNCDVDCVENGLEAIAQVTKKLYDLVILDIQMPDLDGVSAAAEIRNLNRQVPIATLTANAYPQDREDCFQAGINHFLTKPVRLEDLDGLLSDVLNGSPS